MSAATHYEKLARRVAPQTLATWRAAGVDGIGVGSDLHRSGSSMKDVAGRTAQIIASFAAPAR